MARRRQCLANQIGLRRIVIQDSNSHKNPATRLRRLFVVRSSFAGNCRSRASAAATGYRQAGGSTGIPARAGPAIRLFIHLRFEVSLTLFRLMVLRLAPRTTLPPPHLKISAHFSIPERRLSAADNHNRKDGRSLLNAIKRFSGGGCRAACRFCRFCRFCAPFAPPLRSRRLLSAVWARHIKKWSLSHGAGPATFFFKPRQAFRKQRFDNSSEYRNGLEINRLRIVKSVGYRRCRRAMKPSSPHKLYGRS